MATGGHDFEQFMQHREDAARAYVRGDPAPLDGIVARSSSATFFAPGGGSVQGTAAVASRYDRDAALFGSDGDSRFEVFDAAAGDDVAFWCGIQHAHVSMGDAAPAEMTLRVTEVFRREDGEWKLVHRHADPLASASAPRG